MSSTTRAIFLPSSAAEPAEGSVVMLEGATGTAYQRLFSTSLWHSTTGPGRLTWDEIVAKAERRGAFPILLIHDAAGAEIIEPPSTAEQPMTTSQDAEITKLLRQLRIVPEAVRQAADAVETRAEAASLLLVLRSYAKEQGAAAL